MTGVDVWGSNGNLGQTWPCIYIPLLGEFCLVFSHNTFILQTFQWKSKVIQYHSHYKRHCILQVVCLKFSLCCGLAQAFHPHLFLLHFCLKLPVSLLLIAQEGGCSIVDTGQPGQHPMLQLNLPDLSNVGTNSLSS